MSKTIAKKESTQISEQVPDYLAKYAGEGTENVSDLTIVPRIKLLQGLSPEVVDSGERAGEFWHTVGEASLGSSIQMVPVYVSQSVLLWRPRKDGGGILARADNGKHWDRPNESFQVTLDNKKEVTWNTGKSVHQSGLIEWGSSDPDDKRSLPAATRMINIIAMFPEQIDMSPAVISLSRSSFKVGTQFITKLTMGHKLPTWSRCFTMESIKDRNPDGDSYFNWKFTQISDKGKPVLIPESDVPHYKEMYDHFSSRGFEINGEEDDTAKTADSSHTDY